MTNLLITSLRSFSFQIIMSQLLKLLFQLQSYLNIFLQQVLKHLELQIWNLLWMVGLLWVLWMELMLKFVKKLDKRTCLSSEKMLLESIKLNKIFKVVLLIILDQLLKLYLKLSEVVPLEIAISSTEFLTASKTEEINTSQPLISITTLKLKKKLINNTETTTNGPKWQS